MPVASTDFIDYIFQFPDQGSFLRDPTIAQFVPNAANIGVQLLIYSPVETLQPPVPPIPSTTPLGNSLVLFPQLANSSVALSGFWALVTLQAIVSAPSGFLLLEDGTSHLLLEDNASKLALEGAGIPSGIIPALFNHPNIQIINDRTVMFARNPSVVMTKIDISHINIVINIFGVYVRDGLLPM